MLYRLVSLSNMQSSDFHIPATIGRDSSCCVSLDHPSVSRTHCQFILGADESLQIRDLGSLNGTYVNGEKIRSLRTVLPGDNIQIGSTTFRLEFSSNSEIREPQRTLKFNQSAGGVDATQKMPAIGATPVKTPTFTMHEVVKPNKQWWEFWKVS